MLSFSYLSEMFQGLPPPSLPPHVRQRWRPLVPVTLHGPGGASLTFGRTLVDSGADDTIFPADAAIALGIPLLAATGHAMRWRGQRFALRFAEVELELTDDLGIGLRWRATVAF